MFLQTTTAKTAVLFTATLTALLALLLYSYPATVLTQTAIPANFNLTKQENHFLFANEMSVPRAIRKVFLAVEQAEGQGARVRRSIGTPNLRNFSPFLMLDHFSIKPGAGFPDQYVFFPTPAILNYPTVLTTTPHQPASRTGNHHVSPSRRC